MTMFSILKSTNVTDILSNVAILIQMPFENIPLHDLLIQGISTKKYVTKISKIILT